MYGTAPRSVLNKGKKLDKRSGRGPETKRKLRGGKSERRIPTKLAHHGRHAFEKLK